MQILFPFALSSCRTGRQLRKGGKVREIVEKGGGVGEKSETAGGEGLECGIDVGSFGGGEGLS